MTPYVSSRKAFMAGTMYFGFDVPLRRRTYSSTIPASSAPGRKSALSEASSTNVVGRGLHAGVTRQAFEFRADVDDLSDFLVVAHEVGERRRFFHCGGKSHVRSAGNGLGHFVDEAVRQSENAADIADNRLRGHRSERDDLRDILFAVLVAYVFDDASAIVHAEVDIDVGHGDALRI